MKYIFFLVISGLILIACSPLDKATPEENMREAYLNRFGFAPQYFPLVYSYDWKHYTSTYYVDDHLYRLYLDDQGNIYHKMTEPSFPEGVKQVLSIIIVYEEINPLSDFAMLWEKEQGRINQELIDFSKNQGYDKPVVEFINTNLYYDGELPDLEGSISLLDTINSITLSHNININAFDHVLYIDLNLEKRMGGWADYKTGIARMGWFYNTNEINQQTVSGLANACYHHEIGHLWGWEHEWSDVNDQTNFITVPSLFGWEDLNGNGNPDIID